jgi:iron complex transport system substrate-binding protein
MKIRFLFCILVIVLGVGANLSAGGGQETAAPGDTEEAADTGELETVEVEGGFTNPLVLGETAESVTAIDIDGDEVILTKRPDRVVVHYTSLLGLWYLAGGEVVGRPDSRRGTGIPEEAEDLPTTGTVTTPNAEVILSLEPNLVVLSDMDTHRNLADMLGSIGIESILLRYDTYSDFVGVLDLFGRLVGNRDVVARIVPELNTAIREIIAEHETDPKPEFLSLFASPRSVSAELDTAHTAHIASLLGGRNIAEELAGDRNDKRVSLSLERIVEADPEVIFVTPMGDTSEIDEKLEEEFMSNQAWSGIEAVEKGRVHYLPAELFLYKPNDRFPEAFRYMAEVLYGE